MTQLAREMVPAWTAGPFSLIHHKSGWRTLFSPVAQGVICWILWFKSSSIQQRICEVAHTSHWRGRFEDCSTWYMRRDWGSGFLQPGEEKAKGRVYNYLWVAGREKTRVFLKVHSERIRGNSQKLNFWEDLKKDFFTRRVEKHRKRLPRKVVGGTRNPTGYSPEKPDVALKLGAACWTRGPSEVPSNTVTLTLTTQ